MIGRVVGIVKPLGSAYDFAFLKLPNGTNVFLSKTVIDLYGQPMTTGAEVECDAIYVPGKGMRATEIFSVKPDADAVPPVWLPATIKWFDNIHKGYGFVTLDSGQDAFLHAAVLPRSGFVFKGNASGLRVEVQVEFVNEKRKPKVVAIRHTGQS